MSDVEKFPSYRCFSRIVQEESDVFRLGIPRDFHSPYPGGGGGREKKKRKKREFRRQEDAAGVLSARRDAIRESFEKVAIIKRAVPSVVPQ